eukprot:Plantae.Rhodophyta-Hildenbrandia_rubra.ctg28771.p1 GENE.Plantae.Rhodophyta-Hildenbrandia_rubra.ctg28771~~Plantae.Rhodophyta-Hildenbrandia_rubra.ctg28771.p1  ORF type:complete len:550 (+),score=102.22 Plantae.Rhodophyta-Hildenbrandia_rubra.ctg28771:784-2433(+)
MTTPKKRTTLSERQRYRVTQHHIKNPSLTHESLAQYVAEEFGLTVSRATISKLLKRKAKYMGDDESQHPENVKRMKRPQNEALERALTLWFWKIESVAQISDDMVVEKAKELAKDARLGVGSDFKFSSGWLEKFKKRVGIKSYQMHGERGSVDEGALKEARQHIRSLLAEYELKDIYNMDETGLYYRMSPSKTLATQQRRGLNKSKERVTLALCSNADGSDKMPPLAIGKSAAPRCFKNIRRENLGAYYRNNSSVWMTGRIFADWMKIFSQRVRGRKVILLVDNASSHHVNLEGRELAGGLNRYRYSESVVIAFLPPNMTSALQPMDMGIVATLKTLYRSFFIKWKLKEIESGEEKPRLNLLQAIGFALRAWGKVEDESISNCFRKAGILAVAQQADCYLECRGVIRGVEKSLLDELAESLSELNTENCQTAEEFAFPDGELDVEEAPVDDLIIEEALGREVSGGKGDDEEESSDDEIILPVVKSRHATIALDTLWCCFQQTELEYPESQKAINTISECIEDSMKRQRMQRKITDFFKLKESSEKQIFN